MKSEVLSLLLGQVIKPYDKEKCGRKANILSVDDFHLHNLIGKRLAYVKELYVDEEEIFDQSVTAISLIYLIQLRVREVMSFMSGPKVGNAWP